MPPSALTERRRVTTDQAPSDGIADPGTIWACWQTPDGAMVVGEETPADTGGFRWLHLDLWDRRSILWIERASGLPAAVRELFVAPDTRPRAMVENGFVALIVPDFEREFASADTGRIGALHVAIGPDLVLTGRHHPLHTPDIIRHRAAWAKAFGPAEAFDLVLDSVADTIGTRAQTVATELLAMEDQLLADEQAPNTRELIEMRRLSARLHRMLGGIRLVLARLDGDPALPAMLAPAVKRQLQRVQILDADVAAAAGQLRLLREELDLQAAQRTNANVYLLSIITILLMPATLVTGFFGMNTGGMPFATGGAGTFIAMLVALTLSGVTWLVLRLMGLVRR